MQKERFMRMHLKLNRTWRIGMDRANSKKMAQKSLKSRQFRRRKASESEDDDKEEEEVDGLPAEVKMRLQETKELQKLRKRPHGVSVAGLALGKKVTQMEEMNDDPFKLKTGGMINMKAMISGKITDADGVSIGTAFSAETNCRDEDADMMKYIEEELAKRKGKEVEAAQNSVKIKSAEDALYEVPEHLRVSSSKRSEEMLSNQMLSGIPEVDLGIEAKIKNIEATEDSKQRLLRERLNKKDGPSQFVPTNVAVNFVQHTRFNIEDDAPKPKKQREIKITPVVVVGDADGMTFPKDEKRKSKHREDEEKATDDFHFEKFRKQFRRY